LPKTQPREILRAAIAERDEWQRRVEVATATLARATDLLREAESRLAEFSAVDEEIVSHRADKIKDWAGSGGKKPNATLPENLIARRKARNEASEDVACAQFAAKSLADDLDAAKATLASAACSTRDVTLSVVFEEAEVIAARLAAAKREMWDLASQLRGLAQIWLPNGTDQTLKPIQLPSQVLSSLTSEEPQTPPNQRPEAKQEAAWRSFHTALLADPEVTFEGTSFVA
jgi:hypothetical protein